MSPTLILLVVLGVVAVAAIGIAIRHSARTAVQSSLGRGEPDPTGLRTRMAKTSRQLASRFAQLSGRGVDAAFWAGLEEALVSADVGVATSHELVEAVAALRPRDAAEAKRGLEAELVRWFGDKDRGLDLTARPAVLLVVGVNGGGKTTSIAKLASRFSDEGRTVLLGAADTFRAAAQGQLATWAARVGVGMVPGSEGADPASVAYDAYQAAKARNIDVLIVDTAGRLQNKANLMAELAKVARVLRNEAGGLSEVLLVLDGTTGQNGLTQAESFTEAVGVTGVIVTKLDGTARGGIAVAIEAGLGVPIKLIGVGEGVRDLVPFEPQTFVDALLGS